MKSWIAVLFIIKLISASPPTPVVLWHGIGDTCCLPFRLGKFKYSLEKIIPGIYVNSLMIGNNSVEDLENSYFMNPNKQVQLACNKIAADPKLKNGFNAIGFSQGSQFMRAVVQRCGHKFPIKNLITFGGQHQGVYGVPHCGPLKHKSCDYVRKIINYAAYYDWVQESLVQATYWHDPLNETIYKEKNQFLADINNERTINKTYIDNLNALEHFVMIKFNNDSVVQPIETEWFGFYAPGQAKKLLKLQESDIYLQDRLGLKKMDEAGKLVFLSSPEDHLMFDRDWFINMVVNPYLTPTSIPTPTPTPTPIGKLDDSDHDYELLVNGTDLDF